MNAITLPGNIDVSNKTLAIATAVSVTLVTGAGLFYMKSRNQRRAENEKKVEKIVSKYFCYFCYGYERLIKFHLVFKTALHLFNPLLLANSMLNSIISSKYLKMKFVIT